MAAMFVAQMIVLAGVEAIRFGPSGALSGVMKSLGGVLILLIVAGVTLPVGLSLRWLAGKLPASPRRKRRRNSPLNARMALRGVQWPTG
jgi:hypothetical protein